MVDGRVGDSEGNGDIDAYDAPFSVPAASGEAVDDVDDEGHAQAASSLFGKVGGAFGKVGGAAALVSSVASNTKLGEVSGSLWERSSAMRESLSAVTKDVASAMTEELVGVSSTVSGLVAGGSGSEDDAALDGHADGRSAESAAGVMGEYEQTHAAPSMLDGLHGVEDMQEEACSDFVDLDDDTYYSAPLTAPAVETALQAGDGMVDLGGSSAGAGGGGGRASALLGSMNIQTLNKVAGNLNQEALLGGATQLAKVGSEWWGKSSGVREQLTNATKDVASAMTEEVKGIASIITADDDEDEDEEEEEEENVGVNGGGRDAAGADATDATGSSGGGGLGFQGDAARSPTAGGILSMHASEGMRMELEGLEMEREMLQARVSSLEDENRELQDQLAAVVMEQSAMTRGCGLDRINDGGAAGPGAGLGWELGVGAGVGAPAGVTPMSEETVKSALATVEEAMALCERHVPQGNSPLADTLAQLKASVASLQSRGELARSAGGSHVLSHQSDGGTNRTAAVGAQSDGTGEEGGGFVALAVLEGRLKEKEEECVKLVAQVGRMKEVCRFRPIGYYL